MRNSRAALVTILALRTAICRADEEPDPASRAAASAANEPTYQPDLMRKHDSNYFLFAGLGRPDTQAKFQLSIRYGLVSLSERISFNFGYTQLSWWDLYSNSSPFVESNYSPEVFVEWRRSDCLQPIDTSFSVLQSVSDSVALRADRWKRRRAIEHVPCYEAAETITDLAMGLLHQSNGLDSTTSRSWNRIYAQATFDVHFGTRRYQDRAFIQITPRAWVIFNYDKIDNPFIVNYLGRGDLRITAASPATERGQRVELEALLRKGWLDNPYGAVQLSLRVRPWASTDFTPWLLVQWWYGYGQRLLRYDQLDNEIRAGLVFND